MMVTASERYDDVLNALAEVRDVILGLHIGVEGIPDEFYHLWMPETVTRPESIPAMVRAHLGMDEEDERATTPSGPSAWALGHLQAAQEERKSWPEWLKKTRCVGDDGRPLKGG